MIPSHSEVQNKIPFQLASGCCFLTGSVKDKVVAHGRTVLQCFRQFFKTWVLLKSRSSA